MNVQERILCNFLKEATKKIREIVFESDYFDKETESFKGTSLLENNVILVDRDESVKVVVSVTVNMVCYEFMSKSEGKDYESIGIAIMCGDDLTTLEISEQGTTTKIISAITLFEMMTGLGFDTYIEKEATKKITDSLEKLSK